ncbi:MAG: TetR/AcrR family transcriptional regulator [Bacilli bacterium]|jgi:AcrR family transcriptional regulator|nr:TetR/AcrR family transcriptional regulator [Bacilli bacterium]
MNREKSKDNILMNSLDYIYNNGLENFSMRKLASKLNCQPASIYYYYASKEDILNDLFFYIHNKFINNIELILDKDFNIETFVRFVINNALKNRKEYIFLNKYVKSSFLSKENFKLSKSMYQDLYNQMTTKIEFKPSKEDFLILIGTTYQLIKLEGKEKRDIDIELIINKLVKMMEVN